MIFKFCHQLFLQEKFIIIFFLGIIVVLHHSSSDMIHQTEKNMKTLKK